MILGADFASADEYSWFPGLFVCTKLREVLM